MSNSKKPKAAPKAVLSISDLSIKNKLASTQAIVSTSNLSPLLKTPGSLQKAQQALSASHDDLQTAVNAHDAAKKAWLAAEQTMLAKEGVLLGSANVYRDTVNAIPNLDQPTIASLGLKVAGQKSAPKDLVAPAAIAAKAGSQPGQVNVKWKPVVGAKTYLVQTTEDPAATTGWIDAAAVTKSKASLSGLTSGKRAWIRVASVGSAGTSAYSSPAAASVA